MVVFVPGPISVYESKSASTCVITLPLSTCGLGEETTTTKQAPLERLVTRVRRDITQ